MLSNVSLTANEFFIINHNLFSGVSLIQLISIFSLTKIQFNFQFIAAFITYVVILIQFSQMTRELDVISSSNQVYTRFKTDRL